MTNPVMTKPAVWSMEQLTREPLGRVAVWASPSVRQRVQSRLAWPIEDPAMGFPDHADTLVVVGGGTLIDLAKARRHDLAPRVRVIAIPSIWGSGAEASPIVVLNRADHKEIRKEDGLIPDVRVVWPELADSVPPALATYACGDCWTHALEGFLSPLAYDDLRREIALIVSDLTELPLASDPRWFEASARACAAQSRAGVGLVHGIAHVLEPVLRKEQPAAEWGHARVCSIFLWPVLRLVTTSTAKACDLSHQYHVDLAHAESVARSLYDESAYDVAVPALTANWSRVLRDPCTRTNCVLIRAEHLAFFVKRAFL